MRLAKGAVGELLDDDDVKIFRRLRSKLSSFLLQWRQALVVDSNWTKSHFEQ